MHMGDTKTVRIELKEAMTTPTTAAEWADRLDTEIGVDSTAYSLACSAGRAAGVEITYDDPRLDPTEERAQFAAQHAGWLVELDPQGGYWRVIA